MEFVYSSDAQKQLKRLPKSEKLKVVRKIHVLGENPLLGKKLKGEYEGLRSIKAWPYRIIYHYSSEKRTFFVEAIEHRQGVYK